MIPLIRRRMRVTYHDYGMQSTVRDVSRRSALRLRENRSEERVMKAAEHIPNKRDATVKRSVLAERFSCFNIPWRRVPLYVSLCLGFFLLGFVPMWLKAYRAIEQRDAAQREVRLGQLQSTLGAAMVDVQRGEYEPARQLTSDFYTNLRSQIDAANSSVLTPAQRETLRPLLAERDEVITLLARSDRGAVDRLFAVYSSYNKITSSVS